MIPQLLETICCRAGQLEALPEHQARVGRSLAALGVATHNVCLSALSVPAHAQKGRYKCRALYRERIESVSFAPYTVRPVHRLKLVAADHIEYGLKFADRALLKQAFEQRGNADDVLLVKEGRITDTYYANIAFWNGRAWITPKRPLLPGTRRARLLRQGAIHTAPLRVEDLRHFHKATLFNAMMDLGEGPVIPIRQIEP